MPTTPRSLRRAACRNGSSGGARRTGEPCPVLAGRVRAQHPREPRGRVRARGAHGARLSGTSVSVIHLVGGGSQNELLCQLTADRGLPVLAGPVEATALGNVLVQGRALGAIDGSLEHLRALVARTFPPEAVRGGRRIAGDVNALGSAGSRGGSNNEGEEDHRTPGHVTPMTTDKATRPAPASALTEPGEKAGDATVDDREECREPPRTTSCFAERRRIVGLERAL